MTLVTALAPPVSSSSSSTEQNLARSLSLWLEFLPWVVWCPCCCCNSSTPTFWFARSRRRGFGTIFRSFLFCLVHVVPSSTDYCLSVCPVSCSNFTNPAPLESCFLQDLCVCGCGEEEGRIGHTSITLLLAVVRKTPQVAQRISSAIEVESDTGHRVHCICKTTSGGGLDC